jgi:hypothetical protein
MKTAFWGLATGLVGIFMLTGCDSTPRERQEIVRKEASKLDTAARKAGHTISRLGRQTVRFDAANRLRRSVPLDAKKQKIFDQQLLGSYADRIPTLTVATIAGAYGELLRATRVRRTGWDARDWDYAQDTYRRLNAQLARIRMDMPARTEVRIRAWQAEFTTLRAQRTAKDLKAATKK